MILLRKYCLVKTQITWPSEEDAALACGPLVIAQLQKAEEDFEQLEMGVWTYVDSLAVLSAALNTDYRANPSIDSSYLDVHQHVFPYNFSGPFINKFFFEQGRFAFPWLERSSSGNITLVLNSFCPDSTFVFPIAAEPLLVINCAVYTLIDMWFNYAPALHDVEYQSRMITSMIVFI